MELKINDINKFLLLILNYIPKKVIKSSINTGNNINQNKECTDICYLFRYTSQYSDFEQFKQLLNNYKDIYIYYMNIPIYVMNPDPKLAFPSYLIVLKLLIRGSNTNYIPFK